MLKLFLLVLIVVEYVSMIASGISLVMILLSLIGIIDIPVATLVGYFLGLAILSGVTGGIAKSIERNLYS